MKPEYIIQIEKELEEYYKNNPQDKIEDSKKIINIDKLNKDMDDEINKIELKEKPFRELLKRVKSDDDDLFNKIENKITVLNNNQEVNFIYHKQLYYKGTNIIEIRLNGKYKKDKIESITNDLSHYIKNDLNINGQISNSIYYDDISWRSSQNMPYLGQDIIMFDISYNQKYTIKEPKYFSKFSIYLILEKSKRIYKEKKLLKQNTIINNNVNSNRALMGDSEDNNNNCLYFCLYYALKDHYFPWKKPYELKRYLKLKPNEKIGLDKIEDIERGLKYKIAINIRGEYEKLSNIQSLFQINLIIENEHCKIDYNYNNKNYKFYRDSDKIIILYDKRTKIGYYKHNNDSKEWVIDLQDKYKYQYDYTSDYILINRSFVSNKKFNSGTQISLKDEYDEMIIEFNKIRKETNDEINFFRCGTKKAMANYLFQKYNKSLIKPEELTIDEHRWIKLASIGALSNCEMGKYEKLYNYDINSMYPSIMKSQNKLPMKKGEFKNLTIEEFNNIKYFQIGIYRTIINKSNDSNTNKLFRFNKNNYYTHIDLENARKLKLNIEIIIDDDYNFLYYSRDKCITYNEIFQKFVDLLYPLKYVSPLIKQTLNILWGSLIELNTKKHYVGNDNYKISNDDDIISINPSYNNKLLIKTIKNTQIYKTNYARLSPFILAKGRYIMSELLYEYRDSIKYIRTDGFLSTEPLNNLKLGENIGELRYEGYYNNVEIINLNKIIGDYFRHSTLF